MLRALWDGFSCRAALEHGLSCEWAPGSEADPVRGPEWWEWWLFNNFSCPSSELWAITLAWAGHCMSSEPKQKPTKSWDHLLSLTTEIFSPESDIFLSGWQMLFLSPDSEHNVRANVRTVIWNKSHVEISVWIPRGNILIEQLLPISSFACY